MNVYFRDGTNNKILMIARPEECLIPHQAERVVLDERDHAVISVDYVYANGTLKTVEVGLKPL